MNGVEVFLRWQGTEADEENCQAHDEAGNRTGGPDVKKNSPGWDGGTQANYSSKSPEREESKK
jgi:hypothetical protein